MSGRRAGGCSRRWPVLAALGPCCCLAAGSDSLRSGADAASSSRPLGSDVFSPQRLRGRELLLPSLSVLENIFGKNHQASAESRPKHVAPSDNKGPWNHVSIGDENLKTAFQNQDDLNKLADLFATVSITNRDVPPVPLDGGPLAVGVRINIVKFQDLDEVSGSLNIVLDLLLCWADDRVSFDSMKFFNSTWSHGGDKLPVTPGSIWTPDIVVLNQVGGMDEMFSVTDWPVVLAEDAFKKETGVNVLWSRRLNVKTHCGVTMANFPFDVQSCPILIGAWASSKRQLVLVPQDKDSDTFRRCVPTSEFRLCNISMSKRDVFTRGAIDTFEEVRYDLRLERFPHFYMINFILPMVAVTMLTIATMYMHNAAMRMNSGTKLLLCIVQITNITSHWRPASHGDIWLDRFQSHCLALGMAAVLQSLLMNYLDKHGWLKPDWAPTFDIVDTVLRTAICCLAIFVLVADFCQVKNLDSMQLYASFQAPATRLIVGLIWIVFLGLAITSVLGTLMILAPRRFRNKVHHHMAPDSPGSASE